MKTTPEPPQNEENKIDRHISGFFNYLEQLTTQLLHYIIAIARIILPLVFSALATCWSLTTSLISRCLAPPSEVEQHPLRHPSISQECKYPFVVNEAIAHEVYKKLMTYLKNKERCQAKDIMMPFRAAQEAGVIRRITYKEMKQAFPDYCPSSATSVSHYTAPGTNHYSDIAAFKYIVQDFAHIAKTKC